MQDVLLVGMALERQGLRVGVGFVRMACVVHLQLVEEGRSARFGDLDLFLDHRTLRLLQLQPLQDHLLVLLSDLRDALAIGAFASPGRRRATGVFVVEDWI